MTQTKLFEVSYPLLKDTFNIQETLSVLTHNRPMYWSWGVSKIINLNLNKGLLLKVSGNHHKGWVLITLDWTDTYNVDIISNKGEVIDHFDMVYFDMLSEIIDNRIERIPQYQH